MGVGNDMYEAEAVYEDTTFLSAECSTALLFIGLMQRYSWDRTDDSGELSDFGQHTPLLIVAVSVDTGLEVWRSTCGYAEGFGLELAYSKDMGILVAGADWGCSEPAGEIFAYNARTGALLEDRSIKASVREVKIVGCLSVIVADVTMWSYEEN